jgi:hypothetical protein
MPAPVLVAELVSEPAKIVGDISRVGHMRLSCGRGVVAPVPQRRGLSPGKKLVASSTLIARLARTTLVALSPEGIGGRFDLGPEFKGIPTSRAVSAGRCERPRPLLRAAGGLVATVQHASSDGHEPYPRPMEVRPTAARHGPRRPNSVEDRERASAVISRASSLRRLKDLCPFRLRRHRHRGREDRY